MIAALLLLAPYHPEWGPNPPVAPFGKANLPSERVVCPIIFPILGATNWRDDYNANRGVFRHTGIDIRAKKMTPIVAPFAGVLGMKRETFWIYGDNGWAVLGTHLNDDNLGKHDHKGDFDVMFAPNLAAGMHVQSGQFLGYVGMSGDATGPHLHFELYKPGSGPAAPRIRNPFWSLKAAQVLHQPIPVLGGGGCAAGTIRWQGCVRRVDKARSRVTLLLLGKEFPQGSVAPITSVRYLAVTLSPAALSELGGWTNLGTLPRSAIVTVDLPNGSTVATRGALHMVDSMTDGAPSWSHSVFGSSGVHVVRRP